jgi:hypothetical protein
MPLITAPMIKIDKKGNSSHPNRKSDPIKQARKNHKMGFLGLKSPMRPPNIGGF